MNGRISHHLIRNGGYANKVVATVGVGNMIGEEDASQSRLYSTSCACKSLIGVLLVIKTTDFFFRVKPNEETWSYIGK
jgi:hypothetical protein